MLLKLQLILKGLPLLLLLFSISNIYRFWCLPFLAINLSIKQEGDKLKLLLIWLLCVCAPVSSSLLYFWIN